MQVRDFGSPETTLHPTRRADKIQSHAPRALVNPSTSNNRACCMHTTRCLVDSTTPSISAVPLYVRRIHTTVCIPMPGVGSPGWARSCERAVHNATPWYMRARPTAPGCACRSRRESPTATGGGSTYELLQDGHAALNFGMRHLRLLFRAVPAMVLAATPRSSHISSLQCTDGMCVDMMTGAVVA